MDRKKVLLLIEDDPLMLRMYKKLFELEGYEILLAEGGQEGIVKAIEYKPALILLDIMMPKMDGFEVLKSLKGNNNTKDIPVVVLTNLAGQQDAERALTMGAKKYIIKSEQDPKEVAKMVKMTLDEIKVDTSES